MEYFGISKEIFPILFGSNVLMMIILTKVSMKLIQTIATKEVLKYGIFLQVFSALLLVVFSLEANLYTIVVSMILYIGSLGFIFGNAMALALDFFQKDFDILKFIKFLFLPLLSFGLLLIIIITLLLKKKVFLIVNEKNIFFIILLILFVSQPFLAGPEVAGKNIIRISTMGYTSLIFLLCVNLKNLKDVSNKVSNTFSVVLLFWSLHPTFSKVKIFELFGKFLNY